MPRARPSLLSVCLIGGKTIFGRQVLNCLHERYRGDLAVFVLDSEPPAVPSHENGAFCPYHFIECDISDSSAALNGIIATKAEAIIDCSDAVSMSRLSNELQPQEPCKCFVEARHPGMQLQRLGTKTIVYTGKREVSLEQLLSKCISEEPPDVGFSTPVQGLALAVVKAAEHVIASFGAVKIPDRS